MKVRNCDRTFAKDHFYRVNFAIVMWFDHPAWDVWQHYRSAVTRVRPVWQRILWQILQFYATPAIYITWLAKFGTLMILQAKHFREGKTIVSWDSGDNFSHIFLNVLSLFDIYTCLSTFKSSADQYGLLFSPYVILEIWKRSFSPFDDFHDCIKLNITTCSAKFPDHHPLKD